MLVPIAELEQRRHMQKLERLLAFINLTKAELLSENQELLLGNHALRTLL